MCTGLVVFTDLASTKLFFLLEAEAYWRLPRPGGGDAAAARRAGDEGGLLQWRGAHQGAVARVAREGPGPRGADLLGARRGLWAV